MGRLQSCAVQACLGNGSSEARRAPRTWARRMGQEKFARLAKPCALRFPEEEAKRDNCRRVFDAFSEAHTVLVLGGS